MRRTVLVELEQISQSYCGHSKVSGSPLRRPASGCRWIVACRLQRDE